MRLEEYTFDFGQEFLRYCECGLVVQGPHAVCGGKRSGGGHWGASRCCRTGTTARSRLEARACAPPYLASFLLHATVVVHALGHSSGGAALTIGIATCIS